MATIASIIEDYSPPNDSVAIPLLSTITVTFDRLMDTDELGEDFFISGSDTDQFVGPGVAEFNVYPDNVSQGDDFLTSPGYTGIVEGTFTFETVGGTKTKLTFTPTRPMAALTEYTAHLPEATGADDVEYTGSVTFSWTTGSGSIEELPSSASTSVLFASTPAVVSSLEALTVLKTIPADGAVEQSVELAQIEIQFNKEIDSSSLDANAVKVNAYALVDHPLLTVSKNDDIARVVTTEGKKILINI